jgi:UDP-N-acetylmuramate--alanine ligase
MSEIAIRNIHQVHFVGIAGVGMSALAIYCKEKGIKVTGSDDGREYITWKTLKGAGIKWNNSFQAANVPKDADLVVVTNAHGGFTDNPESQAAKRLGLKIVSLRQAIARFASGHKVIAVAGTHGKTTTAAMIATILFQVGLDPSWVPIGTATIPNLSANGHAGRGEWFITEADEYYDRPANLGGQPNFLYFEPQIAVVTSVDWDHPDVYPQEKNYLNAFRKFVKQVKRNGLIVACEDEPKLRKIMKSAKAHVWWYGEKRLWPHLKLQVLGLHNRLNATAAARVAHELKVKQETILSALSQFKGSERRLEPRGEWRGITLFDDYAHHPKEVTMTIQALRETFPRHRLVVAFQPHTYSRTQALLDDFARSFARADHVFVLDIFGSARESAGQVSSWDLVRRAQNYHPHVEYCPGQLEKVAGMVRKRLKAGDLFLTLGATDVYKLHELLAKQ